MPPHSKELYQEGAAIKSFKIVSGGHFDGEGVKKHLYDIPGSYPGCSGTRLLQDNISGKATLKKSDGFSNAFFFN
jgi:5-oxoprolinase (ATP-hydrolysing)